MPRHAHMLDKQITKSVRLKYWLFLPEGYADQPDRRWPLLLFLHGSGERGDELDLVKRHGIPRMLEEHPRFPFIVVAPQCSTNTIWSMHLDALDVLVDEIVAAYAVDPDRVSVTGLSMGGSGTWHLATMYPHRFAAVVPVCGDGSWYIGGADQVCVIKHVPVWAFHGTADTTIPAAESEKLVDALQACGGNVRFTLYPDVGHNCWKQAYATPALYEWLVCQKRLAQK